MRKSDTRILTTHVGSLPRNETLTDLLLRQEQGEAIDVAVLERQAEAAVRYVINKQLEAGVDIGNDGEQPRIGFQTYVPQRMTGFGGESQRPTPQDLREFPDFVALLQKRGIMRAKVFNAPQAVAEVRGLSRSRMTTVPSGSGCEVMAQMMSRGGGTGCLWFRIRSGARTAIVIACRRRNRVIVYRPGSPTSKKEADHEDSRCPLCCWTLRLHAQGPAGDSRRQGPSERI